MMRFRFLGAAACLIWIAVPVFSQETQQKEAKPLYLNAAAPIEQRVQDLVSRMTLEEKASQMKDVAPGIPRLGIPAYNWWNEGLHGVARAGQATVFPQAIGLAATWDTPLMHEIAGVISTEARAKYNDAVHKGKFDRYFGLTFWSPNINIFRDPRWGRGQETYGEDPFLTARMGVAFVTGLQGDDPKYLKTVSTAKHFAVHSGAEVLRHRFNVNVSPHDYEDTYTPAFRALIVEGKADSVMCAYNSVRGEPACASHLLYDTLRNKWHFDGYTVSDCGAINDIYQGHDFVLTLEQASAVAVKAGTDLSCGNEYMALPFAVRNRLLSMEDMNRAVTRLFTARFRLGMFDPPEQVPWSKLTLADNDTEASRKLARQSARESMVLLKNDRGLLPLKSTVKTIAVVGPTAASMEVLLGNYNGTPSRAVTILDGIRERFRNAKILYAPGAPLTESDALAVPAENLRTGGPQSKPGLNAEFFGNPDLQGTPVLKRVDPQVDFNWNGDPPGAGVSGMNFSARWTGELVPSADGDYRLGGSADDGFRLYLDNKLIVDDWSSHSERTMTAPVHLQAGHAYAIRMEYFQRAWGSAARLLWLPPNLSADAEQAARKADVVITVVGITAQLEGEEGDASAPGFFGGDRVDLDLPRSQEQMLESVVAAAAGKPLIVVLTNGSALAVNWAQAHAGAILEAWYPGEEGGAAVADVLTGEYNPAGRLPVTFYKSVAQLPPFGNYSMTGRTYRYFTEAPLYPFGFGLSFTTFAYQNVKVDKQSVNGNEAISASADVTNSGPIAGEEVVELYVTHPEVEGAPIRSLAGFQRIHLERGQKQTVNFTLRDRELSVVDRDGVRRVPVGPVELWIGGGQPSAETPARQNGGLVKFRIASESVVPD
jgi:beta-glucosidase